MNEMLNQKSIWKGAEFWTKEIEKAGVLDNLRFFNDIIIEKFPPYPNSGYSDPVLTDVVLDGKKNRYLSHRQNR